MQVRLKFRSKKKKPQCSQTDFEYCVGLILNIVIGWLNFFFGPNTCVNIECTWPHSTLLFFLFYMIRHEVYIVINIQVLITIYTTPSVYIRKDISNWF